MLSILFRLIGRWRNHWRAVALAMTVALLSLAADALKPLAVRYGIDHGIVPGDEAELLVGVGMVLALYAARGLFAYGQNYMSEYLSQSVAYDLRNDLYNRIQGLSFAFHDRSQTGQLMSRVTVDVETSRQFLSQSLLNLIVTFGRFILIAVIVFNLNWQLAASIMLALPLIAYISVNTAMKLRPIWLSVQQQQGEYSAVLQEVISGMRVVQAFTAEEREYENFQKANYSVRERSLAANQIAAMRQPMIVFCIQLLMVAVLAYGGLEVINGNMSYGTLVAFAQYNLQLAQPIRQIGFLLNTSSRAAASGERIFEILDMQSEITDRPGAVELSDVRGDVEFEHVAFSYGKSLNVIADIDLSVKAGETVAFLGPVGSGKTTVLNLLPRFYDVTEGRITIDGVDVRDMTLASLRANVGVVMQDVFLFNGSIRENIAYGRPDATAEQIIAAAKTARLHDFIMSQPEGYETWVGERGITLSGGQKQRVSIARTLLLDPNILVLDDSTSSVDMETEYLIQQAMGALMHGRTSFVIAQRLRTVRDADRIVVLDGGRIVEMGTHEELLAMGGLYREIYEVQLKDQESLSHEEARTPASEVPS
jgi:ABC-type multidrug transport system fused ATPase/permease subunit